MIFFWIFSVLNVIVTQGEAHNSNDSYHVESITYIDVIMNALKSQQWSSGETPCLDTTMKTLINAKNFTLWAVWVLDSIQLPMGQLYGVRSHLGNYDECLSPQQAFDDGDDIPRFKYCVNEIMLTSNIEGRQFSRNHNVTADLYLNKQSHFRESLAQATWGLCVPMVCEPHSVAKIARAILKTSHLSSMENTTSIEVAYCKTGEVDEYSRGFYIFVFCLAVLFFTTISLSYYSSTHELPADSFVGEFARSFCLKRNMNELTKLRDDEIYSMNFMRVISSYSIITSHAIIYNSLQMTINVKIFDKFLIDTFPFTMHFDLLTDTFFTMSGLLVMRGMFTDKWNNIVKYMWKRYVRLILATALVGAYIALAFQYTMDGPLTNGLPLTEIESCRTNWWHSLLMIHNIVDPQNMCNIVSWYVPCDYQLSVLTALVFIVYQKNKKRGIEFLTILIAIGAIQSGLSVYWQHFSVIPFIQPGNTPRDEARFYANFIRPYTHLPSFMVGAIMGYIIYTYKPKNYRKCISQFDSYLGVLAALFIMWACLYGGYYYFYNDNITVNSAVFAATNRGMWAAAICLVIAVAEYGDIPFLQNTFSWFPLVPISRLSYAAYLLQLPIQIQYVGSLRSLIHADILQYLLVTLATAVLCYIGSLVIWLIVEAPIININNMLLYKTWKNPPEKSVTCNVKQE